MAFVLLLIGLPIVMATAFVQEGLSPKRNLDPTLLPGTGATSEAHSREGSAARRLFTWRNALLGGALAFALLGIVTAGYTAMRAMGIGPIGSLVAKGVIAPRERIILAEFENNTADSLLAIAVTEASSLRQISIVLCCSYPTHN